MTVIDSDNCKNDITQKSFWRKNKKMILIILTPVICSIVPLIFKNKVSTISDLTCFNFFNLRSIYFFLIKQANCAFILMIMSIYWTTECLPIGVTSLMPIVLFPIFGIISSKVVARCYFQVFSVSFS